MLTNLFATRYPDIHFTALDFSDSIDYGKSYASKNGNSNTTWIKIDFLQWSPPQQYDLVICCGVLHHMPDWELALSKLKLSVQPGGSLVLAVYNPWGKILKRLTKINYHCDILYHDQENNPFEISFTDKQIRKECSDLNFKKVIPSINNKFVDFGAIFNSANGGLALYVFTQPK
jgi:trans-aconitate methyltransferase